MTRSKLALLSAVCALLSSCAGARSASGFRLPETGDSTRGRAAFVELQCFNCHTVAEVELPASRADVPAVVRLGGTVHELRTDGYLVASIIHPSHRLAPYPTQKVSVEGRSRMPDYADTMTIRQLVDLVAFLHETYRYEPPLTAY